MGRIVLVEKTTCEAPLDKLYAVNVTDEKLGLLIGKLGDDNSQKDHVVHFAPTPEDDESYEGKNASKVSWVTAHAKQVIRMLPGGLNIIGLFIACPSTNFDQMKPDIQKILMQIEKVASRSTLGLSKTNSQQDYLVLHICTKTKKTMCRSLSLCDKSASFRPAEWKLQQFLQQWSKLHTMCKIEMPHLMAIPDEKQQAYMKIQSGVKTVAESILNSLATINSALVDDACIISNLLGPQSTGKGKKSTATQTGGNLCVELYLNTPTFTNTDSQSNGTYVMYSGCVQGLAFVASKTSVKEALLALKLDIVRSMVGRLRILYEDVLETSDEPSLGCLLPPRRAVFNTSSATFMDYLFESETEENVALRMEEIMDIKVTGSVSSNENFPESDSLEYISMPRSRPVAPHSVVEEIVASSSQMKVVTGLVMAGIAALVSIVIGKMVMD